MAHELWREVYAYQNVPQRITAVATTIDDATDVIVVFNGNAAVTWTLPDPALMQGRVFVLVNHGGAGLTMSRPVRQSQGGTTTAIGTGGRFTIISDGVEWRRFAD